ncbi:unnamed protein product [Gongylonema pulchrum]|uniref:Chitin-binding type-2 domain-containing protein n=1 Tax=Gongylonema pulchrum TaxID=637853 RepID=A0A183DZ96_9BILA|nr:unnamed protein product [Gongylonema pulchrum]
MFLGVPNIASQTIDSFIVCQQARVVSDDVCKEPNGTFPVPDDCHKFIQCSNGHANMMPCAPGTFYDEKTKLCDHMTNAPPTCK